MLARVTTLGGGPRGFLTLDRGIVMVEPSTSALLDLADHPAHDAWIAAGEASVIPEPEDHKGPSRQMAPPARRLRPR